MVDGWTDGFFTFSHCFAYVHPHEKISITHTNIENIIVHNEYSQYSAVQYSTEQQKMYAGKAEIWMKISEICPSSQLNLNVNTNVPTNLKLKLELKR